jgi:hypothetical protein
MYLVGWLQLEGQSDMISECVQRRSLGLSIAPRLLTPVDRVRRLARALSPRQESRYGGLANAVGDEG